MSAIDATEEMPDGWLLVPIPEICQINPAKPAQDALTFDALVTFAPMPAVDADSGTIAAPMTRPFGEVRKGFTAFRDHDVIMAKITPCMENGKTAIARNLENGLGFGSTEFHVFRTSSAMLPEFVFYFIRQESFRRAAAEEMTGSVGQKRVPADFLKRAEIPLPPIAEQKRIVAKVETLLARVNAARQRLAKVPALVKRFRQSVLAAACSGQLTEDWRANELSVEPAASLRDRIRSAKKKGYVAPNPDAETEFPDSWELVSMDEITSIITSGSRDWKQYYTDDGPGTFIMAQNVRPMKLDRSYRLSVRPPEGDRDRVRSQVRKDDVLVTIVGANTGDVCRVPEELHQHYVCQSVALMRPILQDTSAYVEMFLNSPRHGKEQYENWIYGEGRPHISFDHLRATAIGLPPIAEQHEIVRRVEALLARADRIEKRLATATRQVETLTQAILAQAFRGELVPTEAELSRREGRDYEPASVLLERIRKTREDREPRKARKTRKEKQT